MPPAEEYEEEDDGHMPDWKRKKNLEKLQQLKVFRSFKLEFISNYGSKKIEISKHLYLLH